MTIPTSDTPEKKKVIIIGTSSGIGRALAKKFSAEGYIVGLTGRSLDNLKALQDELPEKSLVQVIDLRDPREAIHSLGNLIMLLHGLDLFVINAGVLFPNESYQWQLEEEMIRVNALGFAAVANVAVNYFSKKKSGCLVGISSVACHRGSGRSPAYNASKAFVSNYLEGLRQKLSATPIKVIDIRPGLVDTAMTRGRKGLLGLMSPEKAAADIFLVIQKGKKIAYIPSWWAVIAWFLKRLPESIYHFAYRKYIAWDNKQASS